MQWNKPLNIEFYTTQIGPSQRCDPLTVNAHGNVNEGVFTPNDTTNASPATRLNLTRQNTHFVDGVMGIDI